MYLDHAGKETQELYWKLKVDDQQEYKGNLFLVEEGESEEDEESTYEGNEIFEDFINDDDGLVCVLGDGINVKSHHVRKFFKYLINNFEDLDEDSDDD